MRKKLTRTGNGLALVLDKAFPPRPAHLSRSRMLRHFGGASHRRTITLPVFTAYTS